MDSVDLIKKLLKDKKISQKKLAESINLPTSNMSDILNRKGRKFSLDNIKKIAEFFDVSADYILGGNQEEKQRVKIIPLIGLASCGEPQMYELNGYDTVPVSEELYEDGMYAVQAEGDSMSPKINNGSIVYCNVNRHIDNGSIVHYSLDGHSGIKRYKMNDRGDIISLVPINSDYDIITVHADDGMELKMARVVGVVDTDF